MREKLAGDILLHFSISDNILNRNLIEIGFLRFKMLLKLDFFRHTRKLKC